MSAGSSPDLLIRTCTRSFNPRTSDRISSGSSPQLLTRTSTRTLVKIFVYHGPPRLHHETLARSLDKDLAENSKYLLARISKNQLKWAQRHNKSNPARPKFWDGCAGDIKKWAPGYNKSDPTRTKCRESCERDIKICTAPQGERSDTHKVTRWLREGHQNLHHATMRAIWWAQSDERVARAHVGFSQNIVRTTENEHWKYKNNGFIACRKHVACHEKCARGIRSVAPATRNHHHVQNRKWRQFHKTRLSILSKRRPSSPNTAPAMQNDLQKHISFWPTPANVWATSRKCRACHTHENVLDVLSCTTTFYSAKGQNCHACHENEHGTLVKWHLLKSHDRGAHLVRACAVEMHMDISREFARESTMKEPGTRERTLI